MFKIEPDSVCTEADQHLLQVLHFIVTLLMNELKDQKEASSALLLAPMQEFNHNLNFFWSKSYKLSLSIGITLMLKILTALCIFSCFSTAQPRHHAFIGTKPLTRMSTTARPVKIVFIIKDLFAESADTSDYEKVLV